MSLTTERTEPESRFAEVAGYVDGRLHERGLLMAQGNSGGGAQIAFGLAYHGLGDILDVANVSGGPPPCPISAGGALNGSEQAECLVAVGVTGEAREPFLSGEPVLSYPRTTVNVFLGAEEPNAAIAASARAFHEPITTAKSFTLLPGTAHSVAQTPEGASALLRAVRRAAGIHTN